MQSVTSEAVKIRRRKIVKLKENIVKVTLVVFAGISVLTTIE